MADIEIPLAIETGGLIAFSKLLAAIVAASGSPVDLGPANAANVVEIVPVRGADGKIRYHALPSVNAMAALLRVRQSDTCDKAADMLDALVERCERAERESFDAKDELKLDHESFDRDGAPTHDGDMLLGLYGRHSAVADQLRSDIAAARATIAMEINRRELTEEELEAAHMVFDDYKAPRIDDGGTLSIAGRLRATIARLTREKAEAVEEGNQHLRKVIEYGLGREITDDEFSQMAAYYRASKGTET